MGNRIRRIVESAGSADGPERDPFVSDELRTPMMDIAAARLELSCNRKMPAPPVLLAECWGGPKDRQSVTAAYNGRYVDPDSGVVYGFDPELRFAAYGIPVLVPESDGGWFGG